MMSTLGKCGLVLIFVLLGIADCDDSKDTIGITLSGFTPTDSGEDALGLQCWTNQTNPVIEWEKWVEDSWVPVIKDGSLATGTTLVFPNATADDKGFYRCYVAVVDGYANSMPVYSGREELGERSGASHENKHRALAKICVVEAQESVRRAIYTTTRYYRATKSYYSLPSRYPRGRHIKYSESASISYRAIYILKDTATRQDIEFETLCTDTQMREIDTVSGCTELRYAVTCDDSCFHDNFRTYDGTCNNRDNPLWGSISTPYRRLTEANYADGLSIPRGCGVGDDVYNGHALPSARLISHEILSAKEAVDDPEHTQMVTFIGQFLDHDLDLAMGSASRVGYATGIPCADQSKYDEPCYPIKVEDDFINHQGKHFLPFVRNNAACDSRTTSKYKNVQARDQVNTINSFMDGSMVYSPFAEQGDSLWDHSTGLMLMGPEVVRDGHAMGAHMPPLVGPHDEAECVPRDASGICFKTGDPRGNENTNLLALHTAFLREHNRIATNLRSLNPGWKAFRVYHESRKLVGALLQKIYIQWAEIILGSKFEAEVGDYTGYDDTIDPSIPNEFATAAMRFGHGLVHPDMYKINTHKRVSKGFVQDSVFNSKALYDFGLDSFITGAAIECAKKPGVHNPIHEDLVNELFAIGSHLPIDLGAFNIQRGRDHGLPTWTQMRKECGFMDVNSWRDVGWIIQKTPVVYKLENIYKHWDNIDLFVGGMLEPLVNRGKVGETFACIIGRTIKAARDGDRFWYQNAGVFTANQLAAIDENTQVLEKVFCNNGEAITQIPRNVFFKNEDMVDCDTIKDVCLENWADEDAIGIPLQIGCMVGTDAFNDEISVYIDGQHVPVHDAPTTEAFQMVVQPSSETKSIAVQCIADQAGMNPVELFVSSEDSFSSNSGWKCSNDPETNWQDIHFDDSEWAFATETMSAAPQGASSMQSAWIRNEAMNGISLFCRFTRPIFKSGQSFYITGTGDTQLYIHGERVPVEYSGDQTNAALITPSKPLGLNTRIAVRVDLLSDGIGTFAMAPAPEGFLIYSDFGLNTDDPTIWTCVADDLGTRMDDWFTTNFVPDADWGTTMTAVDYMTGTVDVDGLPTGVATGTNWLTTATGEYLYCITDLKNHIATMNRACVEEERTPAVCQADGMAGMSVRKQINYVTPLLDLSPLYASTCDENDDLRTTKDGCLLSETTSCGENVPENSDETMQVVGDQRSLFHPSATALHTLFLREHNRIATYIRSCTSLKDEEIYQLARKLTIAQYQMITYNEFAPSLLGFPVETFSERTVYYANQGGNLLGSSATAAAGVLYTMIPHYFLTANRDPSGDLTERFKVSEHLVEGAGTQFRDITCGIDFLISGLLKQNPLLVDPLVIDTYQNNFNSNSEDVFARIIQLGRDLGVPTYNQFRRFCGLSAVRIGEGALADQAFTKYKKADDVDLFLGAIHEPTLPGGMLGETMACLVETQLRRQMESDRFFITHTRQIGGKLDAFKSPFNNKQRDALLTRRLRDLICENTELLKVQANVFNAASQAKFMDCDDEVNKLDIDLFIDPSHLVRKPKDKKEVTYRPPRSPHPPPPPPHHPPHHHKAPPPPPPPKPAHVPPPRPARRPRRRFRGNRRNRRW